MTEEISPNPDIREAFWRRRAENAERELAELRAQPPKMLGQIDLPAPPPEPEEMTRQHGQLVVRKDLPPAAGVDALEGRIVLVQEVPPVTDLRFLAVRGEERVILSTPEAMAILREHVPLPPPHTMTYAELVLEVSARRAEGATMFAVCDAARAVVDGPPPDWLPRLRAAVEAWRQL